MKLRKNSWHYKWAYLLTNEKPQYTNLCKYFWRLIGMSIVNVIMIVTGSIGIAFVFLANLLIFPRIMVFWSNSPSLEFKPIKWWPCVGRYQRSISPLLILAVVSLYWVGPWAYPGIESFFTKAYAWVNSSSSTGWVFAGSVIGAMFALVMLILGMTGRLRRMKKWFCQTDGWRIFSGYVKAGYRCPIIEFVEDKKGDEETG